MNLLEKYKAMATASNAYPPPLMVADMANTEEREKSQKKLIKETISNIGNIPPVVDGEVSKGLARSQPENPFRGAFKIGTPEGESIWIATEPEDVKLIPAGALYFLGDEIEQLHKAGKEAAKAVLMVKRVFGNSAKVTS